MLKSLFFSVHNRRAAGKIVGSKAYDVTVCELKKVHCEFQRKTTKSPKFALSSPPRVQNISRQWLIEVKRECFTFSKHSRVRADFFT